MLWRATKKRVKGIWRVGARPVVEDGVVGYEVADVLKTVGEKESHETDRPVSAPDAETHFDVFVCVVFLLFQSEDETQWCVVEEDV